MVLEIGPTALGMLGMHLTTSSSTNVCFVLCVIVLPVYVYVQWPTEVRREHNSPQNYSYKWL